MSISRYAGCKYATFYEDDCIYKCSVSGDRCMYQSPNSKQCAEYYGECHDTNSRNNDS